MTWLLLIYLTFQVVYDHWSAPGHTWDVIYFTFQYGWVASIAFYQYHRSPTYKRLYLIVALIMTFFSINELSWLHADDSTYAMMTSDGAAYGLSAIVILLFLWYILSKKLQWES